MWWGRPDRCQDLQRLWQVKTPDSYHLEYGYSCMGYEVAAAIGAKLAKPQQPVYAMVGDGSYMMLHSELQTAVQEGIKVTILLFDNASFGCINNLQMGHGMGSFGTENRYRNPKTGQLDGPLVKVDFAQNAESYGCRAWRVHNEKACWRRWKPRALTRDRRSSTSKCYQKP